MVHELPSPREREHVVGWEGLEASLRATIDQGAFSNGWIIAGPKGAGKATLAYRLARAILDPKGLQRADALQMDAGERAFRLVASGAHPDLFVAERQYDEKNDRYESEITVETIRKLTAFLGKTSGFGGWRVAIIDPADEMNRQASNALLKSLEEPPPKTILLLAANAPGKLIPTIRSRCRRVDLRPLSDASVAALVMQEVGADAETARAIAASARGRPGYALTLAAGDGPEAIVSADEFLRLALESGDVARAAPGLVGKTNNDRWSIFREVVLDRLSAAARAQAREGPVQEPLAALSPAALADAHAAIAALLTRGEAVNADRRDLILAIGRELHRRARGRAA